MSATARWDDVVKVLADADEFKNKGNASLQTGDFRNASFNYKLGIMQLAQYADGRMPQKTAGESQNNMATKIAGKPQVGPEEREKIVALDKALHANLALAHLKLDRFPAAITACDVVLHYDPNYVRALFRRGCAYLGRRDPDLARKDLQRALELAPDDPGTAAKLSECEALAQSMKAHEQKVFAKMMGGATTAAATK